MRSALLWAGLLVMATACDDDSKAFLDPSKTIVVSDEALHTTSSGTCTVTGTLRNPTSARRVDVYLLYKAYGSDSVLIGVADVDIDALEAGATRTFETSSFSNSLSCSAIGRWERSETQVWVD